MWTWIRTLWLDERGTAPTITKLPLVAGGVRSSGSASTYVQTATPQKLASPSSTGQLNFTGAIGTGQNPTRGQTSWTELAVPFVPTRGQVSWTELQVPLVPTRGRVSWAECQVPLVPTRGRVSWTELEIPPAATPTRGQVSWTELAVPFAAARGQISWAVLELHEADFHPAGAYGPLCSQPWSHTEGAVAPTASRPGQWDEGTYGPFPF